MGKRKNEIIYLLEKFKKKISSKINLDRFILFGSRATGDGNENSDVDLLLVSNDFKKKKYFERAPEIYLMWDYDYDVDILCLTPDELDKKSKEIGVISQAIKEGVEV